MMSFWVVPASWCGDLERLEVGVLLLGDDLVERQQPHRGGVDRHRGVHPGQRDVGEQPPHLAEVRDRDADLADLAAGQRGVGVVAGLGRQVEGHRQAGLALGEVRPVELVGLRGRGVAGVGAHHPGTVLLGPRGGLVVHGAEGRPDRRTGGYALWSLSRCGMGHTARRGVGGSDGGGRRSECSTGSTGSIQRRCERCSRRRTPGEQPRSTTWRPCRSAARLADGEHLQGGEVDGLDAG